ncbi:MFS transporter [Alkalilacustris brevis]|uniref:MFS transporter n=1 Tax=Alkalilacustris brevis TaxID=2026338 RepID=UPI000E0CD6F0|nr:MFS transporter [Alkalilacustris brevis]
MHSPTAEPAPEPADAPAIWLLALSQTLGFAALLYIFAALLVPWEAALGWPKSQLALGPTASILTSAALAPLVGRLIDRGWGGALLVGGAGLGTLALVLLSQVVTPGQFIAVWVLIGVAHAACLYEACFAFLIRRLGRAARPAIIRITLVAGFASSLAFPAGAYFSEALGWRGAVLCFAAALGLLAMPANLLATRRLRRQARATPRETVTASDEKAAYRQALGQRRFWLLAMLFALAATNHTMLVNFFIPVFLERGASPAMAVLAASCVGPAQVAGRLALMLWEARIGTARATLLMLGMQVLAALVLWSAGAAPWLIFAFALFQGAAHGLMSILKPVLVAEALGHAAYGALAGSLATGALLGMAAAPFLGAVLIEAGGAAALILVALGMALAALVCALLVLREPAGG